MLLLIFSELCGCVGLLRSQSPSLGLKTLFPRLLCSLDPRLGVSHTGVDCVHYLCKVIVESFQRLSSLSMKSGNLLGRGLDSILILLSGILLQLLELLVPLFLELVDLLPLRCGILDELLLGLADLLFGFPFDLCLSLSLLFLDLSCCSLFCCALLLFESSFALAVLSLAPSIKSGSQQAIQVLFLLLALLSQERVNIGYTLLMTG